MDASARLTALTRFGFVARGLVYIIIAVLILKFGRTEDPGGALDYLEDGGGRLLLVAMAAGFIAYGVWRLSDALLNIERHPPTNKGLRERLGAAGSGVVYLLLAWQTIRLIAGSALSSAVGSEANTRTALGLPGGRLVVVLAAGFLIGVGIFQLIKAYKCSYLRHLEPQIASQPWAKWTGRLGYGARGLVFLISGYFLLQAGLDQEAGRASGIEGALSWLSDPWDDVVAVGLFGFGLYSLIEARFRIIHDVPVEAMAERAIHPHSS